MHDCKAQLDVIDNVSVSLFCIESRNGIDDDACQMQEGNNVLMNALLHGRDPKLVELLAREGNLIARSNTEEDLAKASADVVS